MKKRKSIRVRTSVVAVETLKAFGVDVARAVKLDGFTKPFVFPIYHKFEEGVRMEVLQFWDRGTYYTGIVRKLAETVNSKKFDDQTLKSSIDKLANTIEKLLDRLEQLEEKK